MRFCGVVMVVFRGERITASWLDRPDQGGKLGQPVGERPLGVDDDLELAAGEAADPARPPGGQGDHEGFPGDPQGVGDGEDLLDLPESYGRGHGVTSSWGGSGGGPPARRAPAPPTAWPGHGVAERTGGWLISSGPGAPRRPCPGSWVGG